MKSIPDLMFQGWDEWRDGLKLPDRWASNFPHDITHQEMVIADVPVDEVSHFVLEGVGL